MLRLAILAAITHFLISISVAVAEPKMSTKTPEIKPMVENTVYDKAKWHYGGDYPAKLPQDNAFNHIGFFLGWMIERDLLDDEFKRGFSSELKAFQEKKLSGPKLLQKLDGAISSDMFNPEGNAFANFYYDEHYLEDYEKAFPKGDSLYEVNDTQENFNIISVKITKAYEQWRNAKKG